MLKSCIVIYLTYLLCRTEAAGDGFRIFRQFYNRKHKVNFEYTGFPFLGGGGVGWATASGSQTGCLIPRGPAGITRRKSAESHRKITHFGVNSKVDHLGSNY